MADRIGLTPEAGGLRPVRTTHSRAWSRGGGGRGSGGAWSLGPAPFSVSPEEDGVTWTMHNEQQFQQGPFEMAFDAHRNLLHVTDFRASVLRIVDLAGLVDATKPPPRVVMTIGLPHFKGVK